MSRRCPGPVELPDPDQAEPSLPDLMREHPFQRDVRPEINPLPAPAEERPAPLDSPSDRDIYESPFDAADQKKLDERAQRNRAGSGEESVMGEDEIKKGLADFSCEYFLNRIRRESIRDISLDISAPYRPDVLNEDEFQKVFSKFREQQTSREWRSYDGDLLATGRLRDLAYEKAVVETDNGETRQVPINRLSQADLAYVSENWGLPRECLLDQVAYAPRNWQRMAMTWRASNLCHKPLYFEDVNLERYGHTHGPVLEPIVFFGTLLCQHRSTTIQDGCSFTL